MKKRRSNYSNTPSADPDPDVIIHSVFADTTFAIKTAYKQNFDTDKLMSKSRVELPEKRAGIGYWDKMFFGL